MKPYELLTQRGQLQRLRRLARIALEAYAIPPGRLDAIKHEHNTTFRISAGPREHYVLRIHRPGQHGEAAIRSELNWLLALGQDTDLCVPQPVLTRAGSPYTIAAAEGVPEARVCALFRWQPGGFLYERLTPAHLASVGMFTAHMHEHAVHWKPPRDFVRGRVDNLTSETRRDELIEPHALMSQAIAEHTGLEDAARAAALVTELCSPEDGALVAEAAAAIRRVQVELGSGPEVFGLIHADLHQENYLFRRERRGGGVCVIDFDDCGYGHYLFDLNVTLLELQELPHYATLRAALLEGYRQVRPLSRTHEAHLPVFFLLRRLQLLIWVLQSRAHPAFREWWRQGAEYDLQLVRRLLEEIR
jgi:Ser/Thr protein kinase RdoA (MazF antagonist)